MNEDLNETKNLAYLEVFKSYFSGISHLFEKSKDLPLSVLVLVLKKDATDRDRTLNLSFLPFDDDDLNQINPLQFYSILPINYNGDREDVNNLILKLNQFSAIGGFSINNNNEIIYKVYSLYSKI